jgi:hypothetical protein
MNISAAALSKPVGLFYVAKNNKNIHMKQIHCITLLSVLSFISCNKIDLFNGYRKNMSCKVNGEAWAPKQEIHLEDWPPVFSARGGEYNGHLYILVIGTRYFKTNGHLHKNGLFIFFDSLPLNMQLPYTKQIKSHRTSISYYNTETGDNWYGGENPLDKGTLTITAYDTAGYTFIGSFNCRLTNSGGKVVRITEGMFNSRP